MHRLTAFLATILLTASAAAADAPPVSFEQQDGGLQIKVGGRPIGEYRFGDQQVLRPYFRHLRTPSGVQITRNHPPVKGKDLDDHPTMHPGVWLAFGDIGGADFWRNNGRVRHVRFIEQPSGGRGRGSFAARNAYEAGDETLCTEDCRITIELRPEGFLLRWDSTFRPHDAPVAFGDQEEMGLGVRLATAMAVVKGGEITDSEGRRNEKEVWGRQADWCVYSGRIDGRPVGIALLPHPRNFRRSWFHARDYGLLVANPFGRHAFTQGEKSEVVVPEGGSLRLRFGVLLFDGEADVAGAFRQYVDEAELRSEP